MPIEEGLKVQQREAWGAVAPAWDHYFEWYAAGMRPLIDWCLHAAAIAPGSRVLDLGCGAGLPSLAIAQRVHPGGSVVATDISPRMLHLAERRAQSMQLSNITFRAMDAESLDVPDSSFDAVTFTFGLMFCPDPARAVAEVRRVLAPGGRFAIAVWDKPSQNPFLAVFGRAAAEVLELSRPDRRAPGPFRFAEPGELDGALRAGGCDAFEMESLPMTVEYESVASYVAISRRFAAGLADKLGALSPEQDRRLADLVAEAVAPYRNGDAVRLGASVLCARGR